MVELEKRLEEAKRKHASQLIKYGIKQEFVENTFTNLKKHILSYSKYLNNFRNLRKKNVDVANQQLKKAGASLLNLKGVVDAHNKFLIKNKVPAYIARAFAKKIYRITL